MRCERNGLVGVVNARMRCAERCRCCITAVGSNSSDGTASLKVVILVYQQECPHSAIGEANASVKRIQEEKVNLQKLVGVASLVHGAWPARPHRASMRLPTVRNPLLT